VDAAWSGPDHGNIWLPSQAPKEASGLAVGQLSINQSEY
jgi:hypothetical protein